MALECEVSGNLTNRQTCHLEFNITGIHRKLYLKSRQELKNPETK